MFGLIVTIIVGFVVGVIAKFIMPGRENMGFIMTTLLGIVGSVARPMPHGDRLVRGGRGRGLDRLDSRRLRPALDLPEDHVRPRERVRPAADCLFELLDASIVCRVSRRGPAPVRAAGGLGARQRGKPHPGSLGRGLAAGGARHPGTHQKGRSFPYKRDGAALSQFRAPFAGQQTRLLS